MDTRKGDILFSCGALPYKTGDSGAKMGVAPHSLGRQVVTRPLSSFNYVVKILLD